MLYLKLIKIHHLSVLFSHFINHLMKTPEIGMLLLARDTTSMVSREYNKIFPFQGEGRPKKSGNFSHHHHPHLVSVLRLPSPFSNHHRRLYTQSNSDLQFHLHKYHLFITDHRHLPSQQPLHTGNSDLGHLGPIASFPEINLLHLAVASDHLLRLSNQTESGILLFSFQWQAYQIFYRFYCSTFCWYFLKQRSF